jgi:hypothetical protein
MAACYHSRAREPFPAIGKREMAATLLGFLGRRVGAEVAEGLAGELFRIAFEREHAR